jgi:NADH:ubiquinone oxidoreductase subunit 3 (subunit A)
MNSALRPPIACNPKESLMNSALRLHASALSSRRRQILSVARYASGLSPREIQRIRVNPKHLI